MKLKVTFLLTSFLLSTTSIVFSQNQGNPQSSDGRTGNIINTAVPILGVSPDARSGAMGDVGVAISPDVNAIHWNPAKLAFLEDKYGFSLSYTPWLQNIVPDINLAYLAGYYRLDERNVIGTSLKVFSLGRIDLRGETNDERGTYNPSEISFDLTYARSFGENFSLGTALRYINSNLFNGAFVTGQDTRAGTAFAADVSGYYKNETEFLNTPALIAFGLNISNIGNKMSYTDNVNNAQFLPTNLRLGGASTFHLDDMSDFTIALDMNKLLVPTPDFIIDPAGDGIQTIDRNRNKSVPAAIFGSFSDAPGGFKEEMQEISYSLGLEYWYNKQFALRTGYFFENPNKGNRKYLTLGLGVKFNVVDINVSYLLANQLASPLAQTLRFSLVFNFGSGSNF